MTAAIATEKAIRSWLEDVVIGYSLCPFAKQPWNTNRVRIVVSDQTAYEDAIEAFALELSLLSQHDDTDLETSLLVFEKGFQCFDAYLDLVALCDAYLDQNGLRGVFQVASFHPCYQFEGSAQDARENYTNRAPFPVLHVLRESSIERAVALHPDSDAIPARNMALLESMDAEEFELKFCRRLKPS